MNELIKALQGLLAESPTEINPKCERCVDVPAYLTARAYAQKVLEDYDTETT